MLNKLNVLLNIFNVLLIVFIVSIFYSQKQPQENLNGYFTLIQKIHNNVRQNQNIEKIVIKKEETFEQNVDKLNELELENKKLAHINGINEVSENFVQKDNDENDKTFDFTNVENTKEENQSNFKNNLDKAIDVIAEKIKNDKENKVEEVVKPENIVKKEEVLIPLELNMKDHSKDNFIYAKTIKTDKRINLYKDLKEISTDYKLKSQMDIFISKEEYQGKHKIMYKDKVYLIDKSNIDFKK